MNKQKILTDALILISNIAYDYDGAKTIDSLKALIDEIKGIADKSLKEYNKDDKFKGEIISVVQDYEIILKYDISADLKDISVNIVVFNPQEEIIINDDGEFLFDDETNRFGGYVHANFSELVANTLEKYMEELRKGFL